MDKPVKLRSDRLKELREIHGWSQRELARLCGFGEAQINKYETNVSDPSATNLSLIADALDVSTDYLLGRTDIPQVFSENTLRNDEVELLNLYRRDGWSGVIRLGADRLSK